MKSSIALRREIQIFRCISLLESFYKQIFGLRLHWPTDLTYWTAALCSLLIVISHRPNAYGFVATVWLVRQVGELAGVQLGSLLKCLDHERALLYLTRDLHEAIHPVFGAQFGGKDNRCSPKVFVSPNLRYFSLAISALIVGEFDDSRWIFIRNLFRGEVMSALLEFPTCKQSVVGLSCRDRLTAWSNSDESNACEQWIWFSRSKVRP